MSNITLISTIHKENGKCNSDELLKIIESISPEIIFEECTPSDFHRYYQEKIPTASLEVNTVKKYLRNYQIEHIPVDTYFDTYKILDICSIKKEFDIMLGIFDNYDEYCFLQEELFSMTCRNGFDFLNSKQSDELFDQIRIVEEKIVKHRNDEKLSRAYKLFNGKIKDKREDIIINNIYNYSKEHEYDQALLYIGAEHRKSIIKKIEKYEIQKKTKLNWTFYGG